MSYTRTRTYAGQTILTRIAILLSNQPKCKRRAPRHSPTPTAMAKNNRRNQEYNLTALLNNNYKDGDFHIVLEEPLGISYDEAVRHRQCWKRNIRNFLNKKGLHFKCVDVTGRGKNGRFHHHIVLTRDVDFDSILNKWSHGPVYIDELNSNGNYMKLANYLLKNADETKPFRNAGSKAYSTSRGIVRPETRKEKLGRLSFSSFDPESIKPRKGYYVDQDSVRTYNHYITELPCVEYIEVSLSEEPKPIRHRRGVKTKLPSIQRE